MTIAHELKAWRESLGISRDQAAEMLGLPEATIRNYEQGRYKPPHPQVLRLAMCEAERRWIRAA